MLSPRSSLREQAVLAADRKTESLFYRSAGPLAAILLGIFLIPLRDATTASNLAFAFMALTIVVAEMGGRWAAITTAITSALSLDFFLTQPYLQLAIADKHDLIAFVGLGVCGLIAASLGAHRGERIEALSRVRKHRDLLHSVLKKWDRGAPGEAEIEEVLRAAVDALPLSAAVVRDGHGRLVAASGGRAGALAVPAGTLEPGSAFPVDGGRMPLVRGSHPAGWLDIWGDGTEAGADARQTLSDIARLLALTHVALMPSGGKMGPNVRDSRSP